MRWLMMALLIFLVTKNASAQYQGQALEPIEMRLLAPSKKSYPVLENLEKKLYPQKNFSDDSPQKRLERIEIGTFGEIQSGSIKERINNLEAEFTNWQIASAGQENPKPEKITARPIIHYQARPEPSMRPNKKPDYLNHRLSAPLARSLGRKAIDKIFKDKR